MLQTADIKLRACEPNDLPLMYQWENNSDYWLLSDTTKPFSNYTISEFIKQDQNDIFTTRQQRFVIELLNPIKQIGFIDLYQFEPVHRRAGVGILIGDLSEQKKGYAAQSIECLKNYANTVLNMHQLYCYIQVSNKSSLSLFQKAGFKECGSLKDWLINKNESQDVIMLQYIF